MNRNKKIAMAVVATVMAGTLVVPLAACNNEPAKEKIDLSQYAWNALNTDGTVNYDAYKRDNPVTLSIAIGNDSAVTSTAFASGSSYTLADGVTYQGGDMKPAWKQMGQDLNITWNDVYNAKKTNANLEAIIGGESKASYAETDMFTTDLSIAVEQATAGTDILNLGDYLDYMPNFKNFLEANPIVYLSLLQDGMSTTDGSGKSLYVAPYFDGNDDIERYCIIRQDWADLILNGATSLAAGEKYVDKCAATTSVQPFMTDKNCLAVDITLPTGDHTSVGKVYKNYANVKTQVTTSGSALNTAYLAASGDHAYDGTTGNIVELMNKAIAANANVTGDKLADLFRAYVDACYVTEDNGTTSYYAADKRSDLFNGWDAAWDVDDLVAMLRCVMTNQNTLLSTDAGLTGRNQRKIYGIAPRGGTNDRTPDMVRLACQLYGARGGDSRLEYTYIDNAGNLQDARNDKAFYTALDNLNKLKAEGLIADYSGISSFSNSSGYVVNADDETKSSETFMMYDYCQTQTALGFNQQDATGTDVPDGYNFAPILTPVSKWDVDGNQTYSDSEYFRFTESWRSTKTSGLALNGGLAYKGQEDKLIAALQFVDYLYSEDGQIVSTFGPMATNADGAGGFWYNTAATADEVTAGNYFTYKGVKYSGYPYKGKVAPTITDAVYKHFQGAKNTPSYPTNVAKAKLSFTSYARMLIGSTLPVGVKNQAFEDQLTADIGRAGSAKVGAALANTTASGYKVIRGLTLNINENDWWYTCVPSGLPTPKSYVSTLTNSNMTDIRYLSGEAKKNNDKNFLSIFNSVILSGVKSGSQHKQQDITYDFTTIDDLVTYMSTTKLASTRETVLNEGWKNAKAYWNYLKPKNN